MPDASEEPEVYDFFVRKVDARDGLDATEAAAAYENEIVPEDGDGLPIDFRAAVDGTLWVAVLAEGKLDVAERRKQLAQSPDGPMILNLGLIPDQEAPSAADVAPCPGASSDPEVSSVAWQISTGRLDGERPIYAPLRLQGDSTVGLSREGVVRLQLPRRLDEMGVFPLDDPNRGGTGDLPPQLDDESEARILFWLRAFRLDGDRFGKVRNVGANATQVCQWRKARTEFLGTGSGQPDQIFHLIHAPVVAGSLVLEVEEPEGWRRWDGVDSFHASGPEDRHYVLDEADGEVRFGSGLQGYAPQIGQRLRAREYRYGGGARGNVPPAPSTSCPGSPRSRAGTPWRHTPATTPKRPRRPSIASPTNCAAAIARSRKATSASWPSRPPAPRSPAPSACPASTPRPRTARPPVW